MVTLVSTSIEKNHRIVALYSITPTLSTVEFLEPSKLCFNWSSLHLFLHLRASVQRYIIDQGVLSYNIWNLDLHQGKSYSHTCRKNTGISKRLYFLSRCIRQVQLSKDTIPISCTQLQSQSSHPTIASAKLITYHTAMQKYKNAVKRQTMKRRISEEESQIIDYCITLLICKSLYYIGILPYLLTMSLWADKFDKVPMTT